MLLHGSEELCTEWLTVESRKRISGHSSSASGQNCEEEQRQCLLKSKPANTGKVQVYLKFQLYAQFPIDWVLEMSSGVLQTHLHPNFHVTLFLPISHGLGHWPPSSTCKHMEWMLVTSIPYKNTCPYLVNIIRFFSGILMQDEQDL